MTFDSGGGLGCAAWCTATLNCLAASASPWRVSTLPYHSIHLELSLHIVPAIRLFCFEDVSVDATNRHLRCHTGEGSRFVDTELGNKSPESGQLPQRGIHSTPQQFLWAISPPK